MEVVETLMREDRNVAMRKTVVSIERVLVVEKSRRGTQQLVAQC